MQLAAAIRTILTLTALTIASCEGTLSSRPGLDSGIPQSEVSLPDSEAGPAPSSDAAPPARFDASVTAADAGASPAPDAVPPPTGCTVTPIPAGAIKVSPGDDLQQKLDACAGGTLHLSAGTYSVSKMLSVRSSCSLLGTGAVLSYTGSSPDEHVLLVEAAKAQPLRIEGLGFLKRGLKVEGVGSGIAIHRNSFDGLSGSSYVHVGVFLPLGAKDSQVTCNLFRSSPDGEGIASLGSATFVNFQANDNQCDQVIECIHLLFSPSSQKIEVSRNQGKKVKRHFIELQGGPTGLDVDDNQVSDWVPQGPGSADSHMALSIATGEGKNIRIRKNTLRGSGSFPQSPNTNYSAIEVMGDSVLVEGNLVSNWGCGTLNNAYKMGLLKSWSSKNNTWCHTVVAVHCGDVPPAQSTGETVKPEFCN